MHRLLVLLLLLFSVACCLVAPLGLSSPTETPPPPFKTLPLPTETPLSSTETPPPTYTGLALESLGAYRATFEIHFEGSFDWAYHLETRTDGSIVEYRLHLEGLNVSRNPGDVRVVIEGDTVRIRGPGTGDECMQFPSDLDLGLSFLTPDDLITPEAFQGLLDALDTEIISGTEATHHTFRQDSLGDWRDLEVDLWQDNATGAVLRYDLRAIGPDPLFDAEEGVLSGQFLVNDVGPQTIEAITGCEIDLPLPPDAARLARLPGLITFESVSTLTETVAFYQTALVEAGWTSLAEPQIGADAILLSYGRGARTLEINIEASDEGVNVELLLGED